MEEFIKKYAHLDMISYKVKNRGKTANKMKNPMFRTEDGLYHIYCEKDNEIIIDDISLDKINDFEKTNDVSLVFYIMKNGYCATSYRKNGKSKVLYIHQIIMSCYGNGKGTKKISVDHIDQNPLNNCYTNLRVADRKTQEENTKGIKKGTKRSRKRNAKPLPDGLTQEMIPKYVVYYNECVNKDKDIYREFFKIEKHPGLDKPILSSKSRKISIFDKLEEIKNKLYKLHS